MVNDESLYCVFCSKSASTREYVFPKWLLNQAYLYNKRLGLLDGTTIPYRKLLIPVCSKCNNETLSRVESRVRNQTGKEIDYYLWALKIFIGILYKESLLKSIVKRNKSTIIRKGKIKTELSIAKRAFNIYKNKGSFYPNPPGSVIRVKRQGSRRYFDYVDIPEVPILGIALPKEFVICLPFDKGRTSSVTNVGKIPANMDPVIFRFYIADMGYDEFRWEEGFPAVTIDDKVFLSPRGYKVRQSRAFNDNEFKIILKAIGLKGKKVGKEWRVEELK